MKPIHLFDLPNELYIKLDKDFTIKIFSLAIKKFAKLSRFASELGIKPQVLYDSKSKGISFALENVARISRVLNIDQSEIENNVNAITFRSGFIKNPKLPFKFDENLTIILACTLGDGGISRSGYELHYTNKVHKQVDSFLSAVEKVFGDVKLVTDKVRDDNVRMVKISGVLGRILVKVLNIPLGKKIFYDFSLPDILIDCNPRSKVSFMRRLFDDEGTVSNSTYMISLKTAIEKNSKIGSIPQRLLDLAYFLREFEIRSKVMKVKNRSYLQKGKLLEIEDWCLNIHDRKSLQLFAENVGFDIDYKMQRLHAILDSYKLWETPKNESLNFFLNSAKELVLKKGNFTSKDLSISTNRSVRRTNKIITKLLEKRAISKVDNKIRNRSFTL